METNDYESIKNKLKMNFIANLAQKKEFRVTDLNEGSVIMTQFEAIANVLEEAYIDTRLGFQSNLQSIATSIFDFKKKEGLNASVEVVFSREIPLDTPVTISSGTVVSDGSHRFTTTFTATIPANETESNTVTAQAEAIGAEYNVPADTVNTIISVVSNQITSVTNPKKGTGGADQESNTDMLARFKTYINGLQGTNFYGLKAGLLKNPKVRSVSIIEHFNQNDNPYNVTVYVDDGTGNMSDELRQELRDLIDGDGTEVNSGLRAAGINVELESCTQLSVDVEANITLYRIDENVAEANLKDSLESAINGLNVNEDVLFADILTALKQTGSYVKNIKNLKLNGEQNIDIPIAENQIARLGKVNFIWETE